MKISVVVPAFNEERLLAATLQSIHAAAGALEGSYEVIVCDNNSTDRTAEIARAAGATVVFEPVNQISRARNAGAARASGDWLIFVDADSLPTRELFLETAKSIATRQVIGGGSTVAFESDDLLVRAAIATWNVLSRAARWAAGSFIFCEAAAFREIGGFSAALYAGEEIDFSRRIKRLGRFVILHRHPLRTSGRKVRLYTKGEHLRFLLRTLLGGGRTLRSRQESYFWYDGRR